MDNQNSCNEFIKLCELNKIYINYMINITVEHKIKYNENEVFYRVNYPKFGRLYQRFPYDMGYKDFDTVSECEDFIKIKLSDKKYCEKCLRYMEV